MNNNPIQSALEFIKNGNWEAAHQIAQSNEGQYPYDKLHAYLHRIEGDTVNARYWYKNCNTVIPTVSFEEELRLLIEEFKDFDKTV